MAREVDVKYYTVVEADSLKELEKNVEFYLGRSTYRPLGGPFTFGQFNNKFGQALISTSLYQEDENDRAQTHVVS